MKIREIAAAVGGKVLGDPDREISGISGIEEARPGDITFLSSPSYLKFLGSSEASCVIVKEPVEGIAPDQLIVESPQYAFARVIELLHPSKRPAPAISREAVVSAGASVGRGVTIMPFAFVSDGASIGDGTVIYPGVFVGAGSRIGAACVIHANVAIREGVTIGDRVTIHDGTVIGSDGFGYVFHDGEHFKIPQVGGVIVGDDVEIGANVAIDRATIGNTVVEGGTKIDNLVQIGHNVKVGKKSLLVGQVGIGGSSVLGDFVTLAGQVGIADHASIEAGTIVAAQAGLSGRIPKGVYGGSPGLPHKTWLRAQAVYARLPEIHKKIREMEERIRFLEKGESR